MTSDRNPLVIPKAGSSRKGCAKCGSEKWTGRNIQGAVTFTCTDCKFQWYGGLPQTPMDPSIPTAPESYEPTVKFVENQKVEGGVEEIRRRPDQRTDFRKGALIPTDEE
jgi:hypothetical protein